jgi:hypothetical protein
LGTPVFSNNKTDCHDISEIVLKEALNTVTLLTRNISFVSIDYQPRRGKTVWWLLVKFGIS